MKPAMWDDPFENLIFQQNAVVNSGQSVGFETIRETYFGQCWTLNVIETDALWRIYSPNKNGIRVRTTMRKLWDGFYNANYKWAMISFYFGKIDYAAVGEIQDFFEDPDNFGSIFDSSGTGAVRTLLIKRLEFQHENEVRLIFKDSLENPIAGGQIYQYDIDPNELFDEFFLIQDGMIQATMLKF